MSENNNKELDIEGLQQALRNIESAITQVAEITPEQRKVEGSENQIEDAASAEEQKQEQQETDHEDLQDKYLQSLDYKINQISECVSTLNKSVAHWSARTELLQAEADGKRTDNGLRKDMADKTFLFMERWCAFVAIIVFIYVGTHDGNPPVEVMLALLGTCTVSIIGLVGFVVSGLFKSNSKSSNSSKE